MKRMIREELIQKISELDVEELASAVAKAENSLQLPSEAPASKKMVVINTSGEQEMDDIPSGGTQLYEHTLVCSAYPSISSVKIVEDNGTISVVRETISSSYGSKTIKIVNRSSSATTNFNIAECIFGTMDLGTSSYKLGANKCVMFDATDTAPFQSVWGKVILNSEDNTFTETIVAL